MALLTTFATTPIVSFLYPPWYQVKIEAWKRGEIDWDTGAPIRSSSETESDRQKSSLKRVGRLLVYLRLDSLPALLNLLSLFGSQTAAEPEAETTDAAGTDAVDDSVLSEGPKRAVWAHGIRLLQLTDRDSSVMTVSQVADYSRHDPIVNTFRTVGQLHNLAASGEVAVMPEIRFSEALTTKAGKMASDLLLLPWSETGGMGDTQLLSAQTVDQRVSSVYATFVKSVLETKTHNIAVFFSRSEASVGKGKGPEGSKLTRAYSFGAMKEDMPIAPLRNKPYHIFLAYFGDEDDLLALRIVLQLCENSKATASILRVSSTSNGGSSSSDELIEVVTSRLPADTASRVSIRTVPGVTTAEELVSMAAAETSSEESKTPSLIVMGRSSGTDMDNGKLEEKASDDLRTCLGSLAGFYTSAGIGADLLVVQSRSSSSETMLQQQQQWS